MPENPTVKLSSEAKLNTSDDSDITPSLGEERCHDLFADSLVGSTLGDTYKLVQIVGYGGMGVVYLARHLMLETTVAIKVLRPEMVRKENVRRFKQEATTAMRLSHPGIVRVHNFSIHHAGSNAIPYIVMEFIEGDTLGDYLRRGALEPKQAAEIIADVAVALAYAHAHNIFHRDLKPNNIALIEQGGKLRARVVDFGIAKALDSDMALTQTGEAIGSPRYMSPEQCLGRNVDARSDIYSLGCVLYECLAGRPPFDGESIYELIYAHTSKAPQPIPRRDLKHEAALELLAVKMLAKDPSDRPQSMLEVAEKLNDIAAGASADWLASAKLATVQARKRHVFNMIGVGLCATIVCYALFLYFCHDAFFEQRSDGYKPTLMQSNGQLVETVPTHGDIERQLNEAESLLHMPGRLQDAVSALEAARRNAENINDESDTYFAVLRELVNAYKKTNPAEATPLQHKLEVYQANRIYFGDANINAQKIAELWAKKAKDPGNQQLTLELIKTLNDQSAFNFHRGNYKAAEGIARQSVELAAQADANNEEVIRANIDLARALFEQNQFAEADKYFAIAQRQLQDTKAPPSRRLANMWNTLAYKAYKVGHINECEKYYRRALDEYTGIGCKIDSGLVDTYNGLGLVALARDEEARKKGEATAVFNEQAESYFQKALAMCARTLPPGHHDQIWPLLNLAKMYNDRHDLKSADEHLQLADLILSYTSENYSLDRAYWCEQKAWLCRQTGRPAEAARLLEQAKDIRRHCGEFRSDKP
jgi:serine/threonine protein kinase